MSIEFWRNWELRNCYSRLCVGIVFHAIEEIIFLKTKQINNTTKVMTLTEMVIKIGLLAGSNTPSLLYRLDRVLVTQ